MGPESHQLPKTHRALVLKSTNEPPTVENIPTPQPCPGSAVVRIVVASVASYSGDVYNGKRQYAFPTPLVVGASAIGRVAATGPDATKLKEGQLVFLDCVIRARDDPTGAVFLSGIHEGYTEGSVKLMRGEWRDSTYAEYCKIPIENCHPLNETLLCGKLGYSIEDVAMISWLLVPYGGLRDIDLRPGETIIVAPATGSFGGLAVLVALAMGAKVIAMGRNVEALKKIQKFSDRIEVVPITGNVQEETQGLLKHGPIDAFFDISPPHAIGTTHIKSGIMALRAGGRVSLMSGLRGDVPIPLGFVMHRDIQLKGKWMYPREAVGELVKMVEVGVLKLGESAGIRLVGKFGLEDWEIAFKTAAENNRFGEQALLAP